MVGERPLISAIVVSYETRDLTLETVASLEAFLPPGSDIWVVDNASTDGSADALRSRHPAVNLIELSEKFFLFDYQPPLAPPPPKLDWLSGPHEPRQQMPLSDEIPKKSWTA